MTNRLTSHVAAVAALAMIGASAARADDPAVVLKTMSDYLKSQPNLSASFESDIEVITPELQKLQLTSSGQMKLSRPDKLRIQRVGGYSEFDLAYDGKMLSIYGNRAKAYVQSEMPGTVNQLVDALQARTGIAMPGTDLLLTDAANDMLGDVGEGRHIGVGVIDGVECEHLAFRGPDVDWQIWIESGARPFPRKYVITSKTLTGAPQYTIRIRDWKTDAFADAETFAFKPPAGASKVDLDSGALVDLDEVPPGNPMGAKK